MGSDAHIYVFDHENYVGEVVPAFKEFLRTGTTTPWLADILSTLQPQYAPHWPELPDPVGTDLDRHCTYLGSHLDFDHTLRSEYVWSSEWALRVCRSGICPDRSICPFHLPTSFRPAYELLMVFEAMVVERALGPGQFVGRSMNVGHYNDALNRFGVGPDDRLRDLLWRLGTRGFVVGYGWANSDGIHGWLDPAETAELARHLSRLPIPRYDPTFESMHCFCPVKPGPYESPDGDVINLSLSFVRTVASIAEQEGKGVLWGNDVYGIIADE